MDKIQNKISKFILKKRLDKTWTILVDEWLKFYNTNMVVNTYCNLSDNMSHESHTYSEKHRKSIIKHKKA